MRRLKPIILLLAAAGLIVAGLVLPVRDTLEHILAWVDGLGAWGPVILAGIYIAACVLMLPGSILTLGAGALFGVVVGTVVVSIASTIGATLAFLVGRYLARDWVAAKLARRPNFAAIDRAVGLNGFKIVLLTRLSPVFPFNLLNFGYGLTPVPLGKYVLASWIGMIPGTIMYVYLGSLVGLAGGDQEMTTSQWALYGMGLAATVAVTVLITRVARKALREAVPTDQPSASSEESIP